MSKIQVECSQCKKPLVRWASKLKRAKFGSFCDRDCLGLFRTAHLVGDWAANYKTGTQKDRNYVMIPAPWHPNKNHKGYVALHRLVAEIKYGRFLTSDEVVHHKDHDPSNNHWDNLVVMTHAEHAKEHISERIRNEKGQVTSEAI